MKLLPAPFLARRITVRLATTAVLFHATQFRVRTRTRAHGDLLGYVTFGPRTKGTVDGLPVRAGLLVAAAPGVEARFVVDTDWESVTLLVPPRILGEQLKARQREHAFRWPRDVELMEAGTDEVLALFDWGRRLATTAARQPAIFDDRPDQRAAAEVELLEMLLRAVGTAERLEPSRSDATRQSYSLVVKTAEDHALSRIGEHLHVSELCRAAGVSERTLEYAFKECLGLSPVTYLIRLRLHRVRQALLAASQGTTTVSTEALNGGFWHFGEFSRAYKACFGELPSDTLRRKSLEEPTPGGSAAPPRAGRGS
ncbi:MAG: helix-turn-helix domain-containing protein [Burkholderiales bacterium]|nr:helix-turn-helix domain-containing protein [Burkholderiales bacterium]